MANILLVVANSGTPTTGDALQKTLLESIGHTVTYRNDEATEDITGMDGVVISESCSSGTILAKYTTVAIPVVSNEDGNWDELGMATGASNITTATISIADPTHPIADGPHGTFTGDVTFLTSALANGMKRTFGGPDAPGAVMVASVSGNAVLLAAETGASLLSGTAPARRVIYPPRDLAMGSLTVDAENLFKNLYAWAFDTGGGAPQNVSIVAATETDVASVLTVTGDGGAPAALTVVRSRMLSVV